MLKLSRLNARLLVLVPIAALFIAACEQNLPGGPVAAGPLATIAVRPSYGLGDEDIARMLTESFSAAEQDMIERSLRESRVEAERLVLATRAALLADGNLLSTEQRAAVEGLLAAVQRVREGNDQNLIDAAVEALAQGTEEFAAKRMNRSIRSALAGKRVEDV